MQVTTPKSKHAATALTPTTQRNKATVPRSSSSHTARKKQNNTTPLMKSNTMLLAAAGEEDITQKFLLTREVDAQISDVEEEIRLLHARQSKSKAVIRNILSEAEEKAQELAETQENLAVIYEASLVAVRDRIREEEVVGGFRGNATLASEASKSAAAVSEEEGGGE
jgi:hypothetical protein